MEHYFTNNESLRSELRILDYKYKNYNLEFYSDNGVFSKNKIDYGSRLLVETFLEQNKDSIANLLDVGCGYGFIGITLAKILNCKVTLVDVNKRAIHLTKMNGKENKIEVDVLESNGYESVNKTFDCVITNPPIRAGKKTVLTILLEAEKYLNEKGTLWFVIRKDQGAKSIIKEIEKKYYSTVLKKEKGFYIINAKKKLT